MDQLLEILSNLHPDVDFEMEDRLIDDAILDSLDIVDLITAISDEFDVTITAKDIMPENFNSAEAMYDLIQRIRDEE
ncbi:MAG: acyl carrier protein [Oscillospiraceae bacterium]|nr:acyl carrier protein [Oscillospiraceae bacterium]